MLTKISSNDAERLFQDGLDQFAGGLFAEAVASFRAAISADPGYFEAHHGLIRALREVGQVEPSIAAALALTALTPKDPLAHTALSISLQKGGHISEAEAAAARARILEWKAELESTSKPENKP